MAKAETKAVAVPQKGSAVAPSFMKGSTANTGNLDSSDLILPRLKLLQKISPEIEEFKGAAIDGQFWHTVAEESLVGPLRAVPIFVRKSVILWAPRGDDRRILARSNDTVHWDQGGNEKFEVKPKNAPKITYDTKGSVAESGLLEFGSSVPGDPNSAPAASLTYNWLWYLIDYPDLSPVVVINTRSSVRQSKALWGKIDLRRDTAPMYGMVFDLDAKMDGTADEPYYNYSYRANGYVETEELFLSLKAMNEKFGATNWRAADEEDDGSDPATSSSGPSGDKTGRAKGNSGSAF